MRAREFIVETTEEDRAIISLSSAIYDHIKQYADSTQSIIKVGKIGDLFETPMPVLDDVTLRIESDELIKARIKREYPDDDEDSIVAGLWYADPKTIILNLSLIGSTEMSGSIAHELRHALDDFKSDFKAGQSKRYATPKSKAHRNVTNDPFFGDVSYLAEPAEINARFLQAMNAMVPVIRQAFKLSPEKTKPAIMQTFRQTLDHYQIADLFPEKEKSTDYKRIVKRGMDFIQKEIAHQEQLGTGTK